MVSFTSYFLTILCLRIAKTLKRWGWFGNTEISSTQHFPRNLLHTGKLDTNKKKSAVFSKSYLKEVWLLAPHLRLSAPAASRHAPIAPDCLIGTFLLVTSLDTAQTVIHLFSSHRCSFSVSLRSPRSISRRAVARVLWSLGSRKINDKWLGYL